MPTAGPLYDNCPRLHGGSNFDRAATGTNRSKGQVFIAGAVLLIVVLALLRQSFLPLPAAPMTSDDLLDNIEKEFRYTAGISHKLQQDKLSNLSAFFRDSVAGFEGLYALAFTKENSYSIMVGNNLRSGIGGSLQASGSSPSFAELSVPDRSSQAFDFSAPGNVTITLSYTKGGETFTESFSLDTNGRSYAFYDISIKEFDKLLRRKGVITVSA